MAGSGSLQIVHVDAAENLSFASGGVTLSGIQPGPVVLVADADCYFLCGTNPAPDSTTGAMLPAGVPVPIELGKGTEKIGVRGKSGSGILSIWKVS